MRFLIAPACSYVTVAVRIHALTTGCLVCFTLKKVLRVAVEPSSFVGFENFDTKNEFEQLLINFTNESLQDTFNKQVFNNELKLYEEEGIDVVVSTCPDNAECLKMLSSKPKGIIPRYVSRPNDRMSGRPKAK